MAAKLTPGAHKYYKPHFGLISLVIGLVLFISIDIGKIFLDVVPVADLLNIFISAFFLALENFYYHMKLGPNYLKGREGKKKQAIFWITWFLGLIPLLDGVDFDETIDFAGMLWVVHDEDIENANEKYVQEMDAKAQQQANDNARLEFEEEIRQQRREEASQPPQRGNIVDQVSQPLSDPERMGIEAEDYKNVTQPYSSPTYRNAPQPTPQAAPAPTPKPVNTQPARVHAP